MTIQEKFEMLPVVSIKIINVKERSEVCYSIIFSKRKQSWSAAEQKITNFKALKFLKLGCVQTHMRTTYGGAVGGVFRNQSKI